MNPPQCCTNLKGLLSMERAAIRCHLDTHPFPSPPTDPREAVRSFIEGYGALMRTLYCSHVCPDRAHCGLAQPRAEEAGAVAEKPAV